MDFNSEAPTAPPPVQKLSYPWSQKIDYKSGKVAQAFALKAMPEDVKAGFSYYDRDAKTTVPMPAFRAIVVASLSGVSGTTKMGDQYVNYWSNLVKDTRTDVLEVKMQGADKPQYTGIYKDIKPEFPQGVSYTQVLICYVPETQLFMSINLTVGLQEHLKRCIAVATGTTPKKVNLFGLCDLTSQYWGFKFTGGFSKVDKEGNPYTNTGEMYFMPDCEVFVINEKPGFEAQFALLNQGSEACSDYVQAEQDRIYGVQAKQNKKQADPMPEPIASVQPAPAQRQPLAVNFPAEVNAAFPDTAPPVDVDELPF